MQGGGLREVSYARWVSREVDYARYESPSEMFHSLIFYISKLDFSTVWAPIIIQ